MEPLNAEWLRHTLLVLPPLLLSLTLHEYAHARVALAFGDPTAQQLGRVSLNPLRHLDPVGTLVLIFTGLIGWAKPVPVNYFNLHPRRLGDICVSAAGPLTNLALAITAAILLRIWLKVPQELPLYDAIFTILLYSTIVNLALCCFNIIPLFPLDGHHIVRELLPSQTRMSFMRWQMRFGWPILIALMLGPRLVEILLGRELTIDPLGLYFSHIIHPILGLMGLV